MLNDVSITSPTNGQVLKYNGTNWVNNIDTDTGITSLNSLTGLSQTFATNTTGNDFNISSANSTHTFNLPTASATNRGALNSADWSTFNNKENVLSFSSPLSRTSNTISINQANSTTNGFLSSTDWSIFNNKQNTITLTTTGNSGASTFTSNTLNIPNYTLAGLGGQPQLNGTGFVKANGTTISYDSGLKWFDYIVGKTSVVEYNITGGVVQEFSYNGSATKYYRFIGNPYSSATDIIYATFSGGVLSNPVASKLITV